LSPTLYLELDNENLENLVEIKTKLSKTLDAYSIPIKNHNPPLLPSEIPDIHQLLACINPWAKRGSLVLKMPIWEIIA
jgi:hypothetical protein